MAGWCEVFGFSNTNAKVGTLFASTLVKLMLIVFFGMMNLGF